MARFQKKPVVIEAFQFTGDNPDELNFFTSGYFRLVDPEDRVDDPDMVAEVWDKLHSTWVGVAVGQWIIRGVQGEFYPCDPTVFEASYEEERLMTEWPILLAASVREREIAAYRAYRQGYIDRGKERDYDPGRAVHHEQ